MGSQMKVSENPSWMNNGKDKFSLHEMPGGKFILSSSKWSNWAVAIRHTTGTAVSTHGAYAERLDGHQVPWSPEALALDICSMDKLGYPNAVKIGNSKKAWAYIHHGSWLVYGKSSHTGPGGIWIVD